MILVIYVPVGGECGDYSRLCQQVHSIRMISGPLDALMDSVRFRTICARGAPFQDRAHSGEATVVVVADPR